MKIKIKRIDKDLPLPKYETEGSVAFDLYSREDMQIPPQSVALISTNIVIEIPKGFMLFVKDRSSLAKKKGLIATAGIIDQDYCGEDDEILFSVFNFKTEPVKITRGERLGQGIFVKIERVGEWEEVDKMKSKSRGGFGSTG